MVQNARPPFPAECPAAFRNLISRCWSMNPNKRPHFDEIVSILEGYAESLQHNPDFFKTFKPSPEGYVFRCLPPCVVGTRISFKHH